MLFRMSSTSYSNVEVSVDGELQETIDFEYSTGHRLNWKNTEKIFRLQLQLLTAIKLPAKNLMTVFRMLSRKLQKPF